MMKILFLTPNLDLPGGVSNFIKLLSEGLDKEKFEINYFFVGKTGSLFKDVLYPLFIFIHMIRLKKILKKFRPDIVHINPSLASTAVFRDFIFLKIIKNEGYPVILLVHGWQEKISNTFENVLFKNYFKNRFDMADTMVVLADDFKRKLVTLGLNPNKIFVSTTMVNSTQFSQREKVFSQPYDVLFCSTMNKSKGPYELLSAIPLVIKKYIDTSFTFVGDGKELKKLKAKAREMGIDKNVYFTGYKTGNDKTLFFKKAHVFVFPSYSEGFPTVVLEAMAAGLPLIITPVGGLVNTIEDGKQGLLLEKTTPYPREIAQKILYLFENPEIMQKMSEHNRKEAEEKYDTKIVTKKIIDRYKEIYINKNNFK